MTVQPFCLNIMGESTWRIPGPLRHSKSSSNYPQKKGQSKGLQKPWYGNNRTAHCGQKPMRRPGMSQRNITEKVNTKNTTMNMGTSPTWVHWVGLRRRWWHCMRLQLMGLMTLQKLPSSFMQVTWPLAPKRGRPRVSNARTKAKAKVSTFSGHSSAYRIVPSVWQS